MDFNPEMLALGRARERVTQAALGNAAGLKQGIVSKLELGLRPPSPEEREALARALQVPVEFFARPTSDRFLAAPPLFRLQRKRVSKSAIDQLNAEMVSRAMHLREMLRSVECDPALPLPLARELMTPEEMAERVRQVWLIRPGPIQNLTALIEAAGVFIVELETEVEEFEGCAFRAGGLPSIIFVKKGQSTDRRRFTLAHELAHLLLHDDAIEHAEKEANVFAQCLLMPSAVARMLLGARPRLEQLRRIKREWKISIQALIMIADRLKLIAPPDKIRLYQQLSAYGWRRTEPDALPPEDPSLFAKVLRTMFDELHFTVDDLALAFKELVSTVERMYGLTVARATPTGTLRMV